MWIVDKNNRPTYVRPVGKKYTSTDLRTRFKAGGGLEHVSITRGTRFKAGGGLEHVSITRGAN
jgi:hypothetical protein